MCCATVPLRPTLEQALAYQSPKVIGSFLKTFDVPPELAQDVFEQVKKFLWLSNELKFEGQPDRFLAIDMSLGLIDEMWHIFILCTREYEQYCTSTFGHFVHHDPSVESDEARAARHAEFAAMTRDQAIAKVMDDKRWQYTYVFQKLGKETFLKWYTDFHQNYPATRLIALRQQKLDALQRA